MFRHLKYISVPKYFFAWTQPILPWLFSLSLFLLMLGSYAGLYWAPPDYQQSDAFRIIYVHVPCAFLSLFIYTIIGISSIVYWVWRLKMADLIASCSASLGAGFTLAALITGAVWGKPMWGTWWIWDARLTSELILLFLYLAYMSLRSALSDPAQAGKACGIVALVGLVDIPIVHFSVQWWHTLHQGPTVAHFAKPSMAWEMLWPLIVMGVGFGLFYFSLLCLRIRTELLRRDITARWVNNLRGGSVLCSMPNMYGVVIS